MPQVLQCVSGKHSVEDRELLMKTRNEPQIATEDAAADLLGLLKSGGIETQSEQQLERLQDQMSAVCVQLINAFTEPLVDRVEPFLTHVRRAVSVLVGVVKKDFQQEPSFYLGQLHAISEMAEIARHQKVSRAAAEVLINHSDAHAIARIVFEHGSIGQSQLAEKLQKRPQNLHGVLRDMEAAQLLRRDELGRNVLYSPTPLTRAAIHWGVAEEEQLITAGAAR
jgi:DNA-binding MarR family transcriptional regulator